MSAPEWDRPAWTFNAAKIVKGMLVALALDAVLSETPARPGETLVALASAMLALVVAELYSSVIEFELQHGRRLSPRDLADLARSVGFIAVGGVPSLALFGLAAVGVLRAEAAALIALASGVVLLGALGVVAERGRGRRAVFHGVELAALGAFVLLVKTLY